MPLSTEYDRVTSRSLAIRGLVGAVLGALPGTLYIFLTDQRINTDPFLLTLLQMGCLVGVIIGVGSGATAMIVAAIRSRGSALGRISRGREAEYSGPLPVFSGPEMQVNRRHHFSHPAAKVATSRERGASKQSNDGLEERKDSDASSNHAPMGAVPGEYENFEQETR